MPIYEYACQECGKQFELLVRGEMTPACPECESEDLERLLSLPRVHSETTRAMSMRAAKARDKRQATDRMETQRQYEESHDRHG